MKPPEPRLLLVEDDATSRAFLAAALAGMPAQVVAAAGAGDALALAAAGPPFDLWLVDARLPDADGASLLAALRLLGPATPALAHTAAWDRSSMAALRAAGFDDVLRKPLPPAALRTAVRTALRTPAAAPSPGAAAAAAVAEPSPRWGAAHARASGMDAIGRAKLLRDLFHAELPAQRAEIERAIARGDTATASGVLHRLRASCAFMGAAALGAAVRALQADPASLDALRRFGDCVEAVLALASGTLA